MKTFVLAVALVMYAIVIAFPRRKSLATLGAAAVVIIGGAVSFQEALTQLVNWNILMIYLGSLVIAELFIYSRVPARLADELVDRSPNLGMAIIFILLMTGIISAFVENVATVLVMAPIALALSRKLKMDPTYFMVGLAVMANLQGTATLVGDPPSMIFASFAGYSFNDFFFYAGRPSIFFAVQVGMIAGALYFYAYFRKTGVGKVEIEKERIESWVPTWLLILMVAGLAITSFFHSGVSTTAGLLVLALGAVGLLWYRLFRKESRQRAWELVKGLDWDTMLFLVGIFVVIGALTNTGILDDFAGHLSDAVGSSPALGFVTIVAVSTLLSGFIDNVPYIIAMLPVAASLSRGIGLEPELYMFALLVGSCMGGNLTPFGASANIVAAGILNKEGVHLNFPQWLRIGLPFTLITTGTASLFIWFVWR